MQFQFGRSDFFSLSLSNGWAKFKQFFLYENRLFKFSYDSDCIYRGKKVGRYGPLNLILLQNEHAETRYFNCMGNLQSWGTGAQSLGHKASFTNAMVGI